MTIVEAALDKAKELARAREMRSSDPRPEPSRGAVNHRDPQPLVVVPEQRIRSQSVALNLPACRENRLLIPGATQDSDAAAIAAFRILRTRILHRVRAKRWTTIGITSAGPNDGKTLTALNLSLSLAREKNSQVVLLDLDMRNPSVFRALGAAPQQQLSHDLENGGSFENCFVSIGVENLLLAGNTVALENASELLASPQFDVLIHYIRKSTSNPIILIDLPPVLSTDDALVVAPKIDTMLLVASEGYTARDSFVKATEQLSEFSILGVVLNRSTETARNYAYAYGAETGAT